MRGTWSGPEVLGRVFSREGQGPRAGSPRAPWAGALLALALLSTGCVSLTPPPRQGLNLRDMPREADVPAQGLGVEAPHAPALTTVGPGHEEGDARQGALAAQLAFRAAVLDVSGSTRRISAELSRLEASGRGIAGANGAFVSFVDHGAEQLRWIEAQLAAAARLANAASQVEDPDMQLALLRLAGPRLEAAILGSLLLTVWLDGLQIADALLSQHLYLVEKLLVDMVRWREMLQPAMTALSSSEPGQVEAAAQDVPALVGHLTGELAATVEAARKEAENTAKVLVLRDVLMSLPLLLEAPLLASEAPSAPALLGVGLTVGGDGVMMGTRMVVSAEWVEMMRQLVRAGVLSLPAVSAAVWIQAGGVMLAQAHGELPQGVREALGEGPEVRSMHVRDKAGAGMNEPPRHHVLPKEFREWFEQRGFTGEMDIDEFCVEMEQAHHEAIHGGGDWKLGRTWPGEWNRMIMEALYDAETKAGRMLTRNEALEIVARYMKDYKIPMRFIPWRGV